MSNASSAAHSVPFSRYSRLCAVAVHGTAARLRRTVPARLHGAVRASAPWLAWTVLTASRRRLPHEQGAVPAVSGAGLRGGSSREREARRWC